MRDSDRIAPQTEKAGYTAGPWEIAQYEDRKGFSISAEAAGCIAERWYASEHEDVPILANARLISAAPELLEALKGVLPYMEAAEDAGLSGDEGCHWPVEIVRAAIRKAEGHE